MLVVKRKVKGEKGEQHHGLMEYSKNDALGSSSTSHFFSFFFSFGASPTILDFRETGLRSVRVNHFLVLVLVPKL